MKYAYACIGLILFGMFGVIFLVMFESLTISNESEYYVLKEAMEAAMLESVDLACYRIGDKDGYVDVDNDGNSDYIDKNENGIIDDNETELLKACGDGDLKIIEQQFVENFTRRFAASISGDVSGYKLEFYDIIESPPKATVVIKATSKEYRPIWGEAKDSYKIVNELSGILELYSE